MIKDQNHIFLTSEAKLIPENAVAAIIYTNDNKYLLQHRDAIPDIFYPDHWGCFGGALEGGESIREALKRELDEELCLKLDNYGFDYFSNYSFDYSFANHGIINRTYYAVLIQDDDLKNYQLSEGQDFKLFSYEDIFLCENIIPYDNYALWMFHNKNRFNYDISIRK